MMQSKSKKIAITGGIGSGKSAFGDVLRKRGLTVFSCDEISKELWAEKAYRVKLAAIFPECISGGIIDKVKLTSLIFNDRTARARLNAVAHPEIMRRLIERMEPFPVSFAEVPLLFEQGYESLFDGVIALRRPYKQRVMSVVARDRTSEQAVEARIAAQMDAGRLGDKECVIVENDGRPESLERGADAALFRLLIK